MRKKISLLILFFSLGGLLFITPVSAHTESYTYSSINEKYGGWNTADHYAYEIGYGGNYRCEVIFKYTDISQNADNYWILIDYKGVEPGWFWCIESLKVQFKWGSGEWMDLCHLDVFAYNGKLDLTSAMSSTLYLRFIDCATEGDGIKHIWYFGDEPILEANWT